MAKQRGKATRPRRRARTFAHVPIRLPKDARDGLREVADGLNWTEIESESDEPMKVAWRKVRTGVLEPLLPAARTPGTRPRRAFSTLLSRGEDPDGPPNEYEAVTGFNILSRGSALRVGAADPRGASPMRPELILGPRPGPHASAEKRLAFALAHALATVWLYVLPARGWTRLKRCQQCRWWFVDQTKNRSGTYCGQRCRESFWNRPQRREARRRRLREGRRQRGGPRPKVRITKGRHAPPPRSALRSFSL